MKVAIRFLSLLLLAPPLACGGDDDDVDDGGSTPDAGGPDAGTEVGCPTEVDPAALDQGEWDDRFYVAGVTGHDGIAPSVFDFARDADGSLVAAGHYQWVGNRRTEPLLRRTETGWEAARETWELTPPLDGFAAVAIAGDGDLALATFHSSPPDAPKRGEIWLDDGSGLRVVGEFDGLVRSLEWFDGDLWAAGAFTMDKGTILGVAVWNGLAWGPPPGGPADDIAYELEIDRGALLVGGAFDNIGGIATRKVAGFDGVNWRAFDLDIEPATAVYALARGADGALYAGGSFGDFASGSGSIARLAEGGWSMLGGGVAQGPLPGVVSDLVAADGSIYATGCFTSAGGPQGTPGNIAARSLIRWDGESWAALDDGSLGILAPWFQAGACGDEGPFALWDSTYLALAADGDRILVGGTAPGAGGVLSQSIVAREPGGWAAEGPSGLGLGGFADRVEAGGPDCTLHALGQYTHAAGQPVSTGLLRWDGDGWTPEGDRLPQEFFCPALAVGPAEEVLIGCIAPPPEGGGGGAILRLEGDTWRRIPAADALGPVFALSYGPDGQLWAAGGAETGYLARIDGDQVEVVEDGFDAAVLYLDVGADDILAAGEFTRIGEVAARRIARRDGTSWSPLGEGLPTAVSALARDGDTVYVSTFDSGGGGGLLFGAWDGSTWTELATPETGLTPDPAFNFNAIRPIGGGRVIAVGSAWLCTDFPLCPIDTERGALVWDGERFRGLAGGVRAIGVSDVVLTRGGIWVGASSAEAGLGESLVPSVGIARFELSGP